ncbi:UNVERIFIED_CONTAM: hypothetical protein RMT77_019617 [Armadillidium vulgare]
MQMMKSWRPLVKSSLLIVLVTILFSFPHVHSAAISKRDIVGYTGNREKKPFCNAFTGCGKKRSSENGLKVATETELNELARHVLAEARLWEILQNKIDMIRSLGLQMEEDGRIYRKKRSPSSASPSSSRFSSADSRFTRKEEMDYEGQKDINRKKTQEHAN